MKFIYQCILYWAILKRLSMMRSILVFYFVVKIMILIISEFLDFFKYGLLTFSRIQQKPKQTICIPKLLLNYG